MKRATGNDGSNKVGGLVPTLEKKLRSLLLYFALGETVRQRMHAHEKIYSAVRSFFLYFPAQVCAGFELKHKLVGSNHIDFSRHQWLPGHWKNKMTGLCTDSRGFIISIVFFLPLLFFFPLINSIILPHYNIVHLQLSYHSATVRTISCLSFLFCPSYCSYIST